MIARLTVTAFFVALVAQVAAAVGLLGGMAEALPFHAQNAWLLLALGIVQSLMLLILAMRRLHLAHKAIVLLLPFLLAAQLGMGRDYLVTAHVTNGFVIWGMALALLIRVWHPEWRADPSEAQ